MPIVVDDVLVICVTEVIAFTVRVISPVSSGIRIISIVIAFVYAVLMAVTGRLSVRFSTRRQSRTITTEIEF
jgi:choline-glycine betaine transporter